MFVVTEAAAVRLAQKLVGKGTADDVALRFIRKHRGWKLRPDTPAPGDVAVAHQGRTVLVLDSQVAQLLAERTLDTRDTPAGSRLYLR